MDALREHYDTTDTSAALADATYDDTVVDNPMIGITVRFPKHVLDRLRGIADARGVRVTALIRDLTEQTMAAEPGPGLSVSVEELQRFIAESARQSA